MQHTLHRHQAIFEIVGAQILEAHASDCRVEVDGVDEGVDFDRRLHVTKNGYTSNMIQGDTMRYGNF